MASFLFLCALLLQEYLKSGAPKQAEAQGAAATGEQRTAAAPAGAPAAGDYEDIPVTSMRRTIANRLTDSKRAVPHYYLTSEITIDALLKLRKQVRPALPKSLLRKGGGFNCLVS